MNARFQAVLRRHENIWPVLQGSANELSKNDGPPEADGNAGFRHAFQQTSGLVLWSAYLGVVGQFDLFRMCRFVSSRSHKFSPGNPRLRTAVATSRNISNWPTTYLGARPRPAQTPATRRDSRISALRLILPELMCAA